MINNEIIIETSPYPIIIPSDRDLLIEALSGLDNAIKTDQNPHQHNIYTHEEVHYNCKLFLDKWSRITDKDQGQMTSQMAASVSDKITLCNAFANHFHPKLSDDSQEQKEGEAIFNKFPHPQLPLVGEIEG